MRARPCSSRCVSRAAPSPSAEPASSVSAPGAGRPRRRVAPSPACSRFQIGASDLILSMISRAPAKASARCGAEAATTRSARPAAPRRRGARPRPSTGRGADALAHDQRDALAGHLGVRLVVEQRHLARDPRKLTTAPRAGRRRRRPPPEAERARTSACTTPPLSGGISASSSSGCSRVCAEAYSRLTGERHRQALEHAFKALHARQRRQRLRHRRARGQLARRARGRHAHAGSRTGAPRRSWVQHRLPEPLELDGELNRLRREPVCALEHRRRGPRRSRSSKERA